MELPDSFPFTRLKMSPDERLIWVGWNPTFHRSLDYGIVLSDCLLYLFGPTWVIGRWRRIPVKHIELVRVSKSFGRSMVTFHTPAGTWRFHTPFDFYRDEMEFDATVVKNLVAKLVESVASIKVEWNVT